MRCPNCGSDIIGTTVICPSCHSRVATSASLNLNQNTKVKTVVVNTGTINNNANNVSEIVDNNIKKKIMFSFILLL